MVGGGESVSRDEGGSRRGRERAIYTGRRSLLRQSHPFRITDDRKDTYLTLCTETPNDDEASISSELESAPPNFLLLPFTDAETRRLEWPRSAIDRETPTIRAHQTPNAISETLLNVEAESEVMRDEEPRSQLDWLVQLADGLDASKEDEETSESPYFVAAALVNEVSSENDEDRQARGTEECHVPRKEK
jgi:hypothetical protein